MRRAERKRSWSSSPSRLRADSVNASVGAGRWLLHFAARVGRAPTRLAGGGAACVLAASWASVSTIIAHSKTAGCAQMDVAIDPLTVETCRPLKPSRTIGPVAMRSISSASRAARGAGSRKLSAAERSALNQVLAKALAFRDAGKMQEAREWAAELVRLLKWHDLLI